VTPQGTALGKLVVGGVPDLKGENSYSTTGIVLKSLDLSGGKMQVDAGSSTLNLPYAAMNKT
jgi:hypothetical protein